VFQLAPFLLFFFSGKYLIAMASPKKLMGARPLLMPLWLPHSDKYRCNGIMMGNGDGPLVLRRHVSLRGSNGGMRRARALTIQHCLGLMKYLVK